VQVGVTLPTFRDDAAALDAARRAEALGLDGVFVFDHLWPLGARGRPALSAFPVLGAVAAVTTTVRFGPLVARVGLVPDDLLVSELASLDAMAPGRLIAGLGTGDGASADENLAYGIPPGSAGGRRRALAGCARRLLALGIPVWVGGGAAATNALALEVGAALNLWEGDAAALTTASERGEVTWGGPVAGTVADIAARLADVAGAGATWAVCAWPRSLEDVAEAAAAVRRG